MDSHQQRFVEDALDLLNELDDGLMQLEANPQATAPLEQVFRTMHTIKGGANMFGFDLIGELTHQLETLYDLVRQGKTQISDGLISITLHAFDKVRDLLKEKDVNKINNSDELSGHLKIAADFLKNVEAVSQLDSLTPVSGKIQKDEVTTFLIRVAPTISITAEGTHPLIFIVKDLEALGTVRTFLYRKHEGDVAHWDLFLSTTSAQSELESYFIFVEGECRVTYKRLSAGNLFEAEDFRTFIEVFADVPCDISSLDEFANKFSTPLQESDTTDADEDGKSRRKTFNDTYIKVSKRKIDDLLNWISELIILQAQLVNATAHINSAAITDVAEQLELITNRLRDTSLEIGLVPIETLVTKFKRLVRDLSKTLNKKVNFLSEGSDTELDKDVIELMAEPMIHIIRNCIDHGIESPEQRKAGGKSEFGTVKLKAFNSSSYVNIVISDDGRGIDKAVVLKKAIEKGIVSAENVLSEEEILNLIFHSGLSTASKLSEVSGRGVGMDVVKQKINELRGYVAIESTLGKGTSIHIKLPLSRSIVEGLLVKVDETRYVVPLNVIDRIDRLSYDVLGRDHQLNKSIVVNEELLPVFSMRQRFHNTTASPRTTDIISVTVNGVKRGIAVDRIEGKMQTVMKPLGEVYKQQDFISGSTILGDGTLALVLDPSRLFQLYSN